MIVPRLRGRHSRQARHHAVHLTQIRDLGGSLQLVGGGLGPRPIAGEDRHIVAAGGQFQRRGGPAPRRSHR